MESHTKGFAIVLECLLLFGVNPCFLSCCKRKSLREYDFIQPGNSHLRICLTACNFACLFRLLRDEYTLPHPGWADCSAETFATSCRLGKMLVLTGDKLDLVKSSVFA